MKNTLPLVGTKIKLNVHIDPIGELTMNDYDFEVEVFCSSKQSIIIAKEDAIPVDDNNYIVLVDTNEVGAGSLKCKVTAQIPDEDFPDMFRTEVVGIDTGINIVKMI